MTYIFRKAHTRGEKGHNGKSLTSLTSLTELEHNWQAQHPRRDRSPPRPPKSLQLAGARAAVEIGNNQTKGCRTC